MKICPVCGARNRYDIAFCQFCKSDIRMVLPDNSQYLKEIEELNKAIEKAPKKKEFQSTVIPIVLTIHFILYVAGMIFTNHSKNVMTSCFILLPLLSYWFLFKTSSALFLLGFVRAGRGPYRVMQDIRDLHDLATKGHYESIDYGDVGYYALRLLGYLSYIASFVLSIYFLVVKPT